MPGLVFEDLSIENVFFMYVLMLRETRDGSSTGTGTLHILPVLLIHIMNNIYFVIAINTWNWTVKWNLELHFLELQGQKFWWSSNILKDLSRIVHYSLFNVSLTYGIKVIYISRSIYLTYRHEELNLVLMVENFKITLVGSEKQLIVFYVQNDSSWSLENSSVPLSNQRIDLSQVFWMNEWMNFGGVSQFRLMLKAINFWPMKHPQIHSTCCRFTSTCSLW